MVPYATGVFGLIVGFILGFQMTFDIWEAAAKRGTFEIGHTIYVAKPLRLTAQGAVCAQDIEGLPKCVDEKIK
jgi:hypothetical protein